ncbi:hypothetical protein KI387_039674, partial [Taxus chinensis]
DDESILTYLGVDDSYIHRSLPSKMQTMLNESTIEINIHTQDDPPILKIGQSLDPAEQEAITSFTGRPAHPKDWSISWSYADMP